MSTPTMATTATNRDDLEYSKVLLDLPTLQGLIYAKCS